MRSLSARLLVLTVAFVMLAEVLIFAPSVARYRLVYMDAKLEDAHLAILALDATPDGMVSEELKMELLYHVGAHAISAGRNGEVMTLGDREALMPDETVRLSEREFLPLIAEAFMELGRPENRVLRILGPSPKDPGLSMEVWIDSQPMRTEMVDFAWRIFFLSLAISGITAALVFLSLQWLLVRPMRRLTEAMIAFRDAPEDRARIVRPSGRTDELGMAEDVLADMQTGLAEALRQKAHLAALGTAVAKINHDLRGILSTALLVSDRLELSEDPAVRKATPTLFAAIDRAVALCSRTLDYVRDGGPTLSKTLLRLNDLVGDLPDALPAGIALDNAVPRDCLIDADREEIFRVLVNLARNAQEAGATRLRVVAETGPERVAIAVEDDGPGLPPKARETLFQPFRGSAKAGGTGLGLAIARDIARAHDGDLTLDKSDAAGTRFVLTLPKPS